MHEKPGSANRLYSQSAMTRKFELPQKNVKVHPEKCFVESTKILLNQQKFPLAHI